MKKLICLFLMLWLPISASSAWAMSTQMQVDAAFGSVEMARVDMPCHDMAMENTDSAPGHAPGMQHNCSACVACFSVFSADLSSPLHFTSTILTTRAILPTDGQTISQTYPPALRPPITS